MKNSEEQSTRRKFITLGASSAAVLLSSNAVANQAPVTALQANINQDTMTHTDVSHMRSDATLKVGDKVFTLGYHSAGDDGDNIYIIVKDTSQQGDGGVFIDLKQSGLIAQGLFPGGIIRVEQFGAIGVSLGQSNVSMVDNTKVMTNAHATGQVISYGAKRYGFTNLNIPMGGIIGRGDGTILESSDSSNHDIITYQGDNNDMPPTNALAGQFKDFSLVLDSVGQKAAGAGIKLNSNLANTGYSAQINNVMIKNIPISLHVGSASFFSIKDSQLLSYSTYGIYMDKNITNLDQVTRDNNIQNNSLFTEQTEAFGIKYHGENTKISENKISGGTIGIDVSLLTSRPVVHITDNAIEKQKNNCIRLTTDTNFVESDDELFTQVLISQNRLNATSTEGAAIYIAPEHFTLADISINNNLIRYHGNQNSIAAINIHNSTRFMINNNTINCNNGSGYRGLYINQDCSNGILSTNHVILPLNGHTLNLSPTTTLV